MHSIWPGLEIIIFELISFYWGFINYCPPAKNKFESYPLGLQKYINVLHNRLVRNLSVFEGGPFPGFQACGKEHKWLLYGFHYYLLIALLGA